MPNTGSNLTALLQDLSWCEAEKAFQEGAVAILPIGATEAHGPHLPLQTDVLIARDTARRGGEMLARHGVRTLILPHLAFGVTYVSAPFAGTLTLTVGTMENLVRDVCVSTASHGCRYLCVSNAHLEPAHVRAIRAGAEAAMAACDCRVVVPDQRDARWAAKLGEEFQKGARHAGSYETSLIMSSRPDLVRHDELARLEPIWIDLPARLAAGAKNFKEAGSELAYFGDPRQASPAAGEALYDALAEMIAYSVLEMLEDQRKEVP